MRSKLEYAESAEEQFNWLYSQHEEKLKQSNYEVHIKTCM
jgi:hypothetical protein